MPPPPTSPNTLVPAAPELLSTSSNAAARAESLSVLTSLSTTEQSQSQLQSQTQSLLLSHRERGAGGTTATTTTTTATTESNVGGAGGSSSSNTNTNTNNTAHGRRPSNEFFFSLTRALPRHRRNISLGAGAAAPSADEMLQLAIELHERMELQSSTEYFRKAADLGSVVGMYMYGIALRSGWGCQPDGTTAFKYLTRAADLALRRATAAASAYSNERDENNKKNSSTDNYDKSTLQVMQERRAELATERDMTRRELAVALYELGQSLRNGWGVKKSRRKGAVYLQMAADMGDTDAQVDIASCFMSGDGVSRDKMQAARYFRLASVAGHDLPSNSWIWKEKYDVCGVTRASPRLQPVLPVALPTPSM